MVVQLTGVAHHSQVRLHHGVYVLRVVPILLKQPDAEGSRINFARFPLQIIVQLSKQGCKNFLMDSGRRGHHKRFAVDNLDTIAFIPGQDIGEGILFALCR